MVAFLFTLPGCDDDEKGNPFQLTAEKISESQVQLTWSAVEGSDGYEIWRSINGADAELLSADLSTLVYVDDNLPQNAITYYVSTTVSGKEVQSNIVGAAGRPDLPILPYQLELMPEKSLAIVREYSAMTVLDYEKKLITRKLEFPGRVGQFGIHPHNSTLEVYVPCSDGKIYILKADGLIPVDTLDTGSPAYAVAVNGLGRIFCSGSDGTIQVFNRSTLTLHTSVSAESDCGLVIQGDHRLITVSSHLTPATMSYYIFSNNDLFLSKTDDPYAYEHEMDPVRLDASDDFIVTTVEGFIYTADENMTYINKIAAAGTTQTDFEFSEDGNTIYSTTSENKWLVATTNINTGVTFEPILTEGYPWIMAITGKTMIVLSSPTAFNINNTTSKVIVEKVSLLL